MTRPDWLPAGHHWSIYRMKEGKRDKRNKRIKTRSKHASHRPPRRGGGLCRVAAWADRARLPGLAAAMRQLRLELNRSHPAPSHPSPLFYPSPASAGAGK
ncbi:hypothetical protein MRX96_054548 [Rhipicephalus microplus]